MTTLEIIKRVAENHNRIAQVLVSGDSAVLIGDSIKDMRLLIQQLQADYEAQQQENAKQEMEQMTSEEIEHKE